MGTGDSGLGTVACHEPAVDQDKGRGTVVAAQKDLVEEEQWHVAL